MYGYTILGNLLCENRQKRIFRELSDRFWGNFCPDSEGNGTDPAPEFLQKRMDCRSSPSFLNGKVNLSRS